MSLFIYYNQEYPELRAMRLLNIPFVLFDVHMTSARITARVSVFINITKCRLKLLTKGYGDWPVSKYSPCKGKDLRLILRTHINIQGLNVYICNSRTGKVETGEVFWTDSLTYLMISKPMKRPGIKGDRQYS